MSGNEKEKELTKTIERIEEEAKGFYDHIKEKDVPHLKWWLDLKFRWERLNDSAEELGLR